MKSNLWCDCLSALCIELPRSVFNCNVCPLTELNYFYHYKKSKRRWGTVRWASDIPVLQLNTGITTNTVYRSKPIKHRDLWHVSQTKQPNLSQMYLIKQMRKETGRKLNSWLCMLRSLAEIWMKGYESLILDSPLLLQEFNESGDLLVQLDNHPTITEQWWALPNLLYL